MILIYADALSPRLNYITNLLFTEMLGCSFSTTSGIDEWKNYAGPKINYSFKIFEGGLTIQPHRLLFEEGVEPQQTDIFLWEDYPAFFKNETGFPFDIFAASFFLVSRYEEYLPHEKDSYGRFAHTGSLAYKNNFLHIPLVNIWMEKLKAHLSEIFTTIIFRKNEFTFIPTYDIDIAYSYKHKGLLRTVGGLIKNPEKERVKVLASLATDPYDVYDFLFSLHEKLNAEPLYFFCD